jgi:hypothetical protein
MMGEKKWGAYSAAYLERDLRAAGVDPATSRLLIDDGNDIYGPPLEWYASSLGFATTQSQRFESLSSDKPTVIFCGEMTTPLPGAREIAPMFSEKPRVVMFGRMIWVPTRDVAGVPVSTHFFKPGPIMLERVGPLWYFGVRTQEQRSVRYLLYSYENPDPPATSTESTVTP